MRTTLPSSPPAPGAPEYASLESPRIRRAFSLTGVVPLGVFLVVHLAINARALAGGAEFARVVRLVEGVPLLPLVEALCVFAPLVFHGALGVWLVCARRSFVPVVPYPAPVRIAMRATALVVLAFLAMHLSELRFHTADARLDAGELSTLLDADLSATSHGVPWRGIAYLVATACVTFHLACGLWGSFAIGPSGVAHPGHRRWAAWAVALLGLAMWAAFADVVVLRATGARLFGNADPAKRGAACPDEGSRERAPASRKP